MPSGQECRACRRARGAYVEIQETSSLVMQAIQVRRSQDWVAVAGKVAIALIVGQQEHNIRAFRQLGRRRQVARQPKRRKGTPDPQSSKKHIDQLSDSWNGLRPA